MITYLLIGLVFYTAMSIWQRHTFKGASTASILRGIFFGFILWPLAMIFVFFSIAADFMEDLEHK